MSGTFPQVGLNSTLKLTLDVIVVLVQVVLIVLSVVFALKWLVPKKQGSMCLDPSANLLKCSMLWLRVRLRKVWWKLRTG